MLRYEPGEFYRVHHDQETAAHAPWGARVFSVLLYLQAPEAGGGTRFPHLGLTVDAAVGRAVMWPSVSDADARLPELLTLHEALPVESGTKLAANAWVHMHDYRTPVHLRQCEAKYAFDPGRPEVRREYDAARRDAGLAEVELRAHNGRI